MPLADCYDPMNPIYGRIEVYESTKEGATINYKCSDGFRPSKIMTSHCTDLAEWVPAPEQHNCTRVIGLKMKNSFNIFVDKIDYYVASVSLTPLQHVESREDISCPGDSMSFNCSIESNSENIVLEWHVNIHGQIPINITYNRNSSANSVSMLNRYINSSLGQYVEDQYIDSTLGISVLPFESPVMLTIQCSIDQLDNDTKDVLINSSCKSC